jgi:aspartate aminotransferase-like enzyme
MGVQPPTIKDLDKDQRELLNKLMEQAKKAYQMQDNSNTAFQSSTENQKLA